MFLRQVDDFAVASEDDTINKAVISEINKHLTIEIKHLGRLTRYNGVDVQQTRHFTKLSNTTYFNKVLQGHTWIENDTHIATEAVPMKSDKDYIKHLETAVGPTTYKEQRALQLEMVFNY